MFEYDYLRKSYSKLIKWLYLERKQPAMERP